MDCLKEILLEGNYMCKLDLKDAYFCVPVKKRSRKNLRFLWLNNLQEICSNMALLWPRTSTTGIHKVVKNTCGFAKHTSNYIPGWYVCVWKDYGGSSNEVSKSDTYSQVSWLCYKFVEININCSSGNRIVGYDNQFYGNDFNTAETENWEL